MSFIPELTASKCVNESQSPLDIAKSYLGRRIELRHEYEHTIAPERRKFLKKALQLHTELLIQNNRPIKSYLWKAEKNGHFVFLFGDLHKTVQKPKDLEGINPALDDIAPYFKTYLHPIVWEAFENSEKVYTEIFNLKHLSWGSEISSRMMSKYPEAFQESHPEGNLYLKQFSKHQAGLAASLINYMLMIKAGTLTPISEIGSKLDSLVQEMDDLYAQEKAYEISIKLQAEGKTAPGLEKGLETIDAVQMGNLNSLTLLYKEAHTEMTIDCEERSVKYSRCILSALEQKEKAFFAPGASHYIGEKGILSLLEKQGVTITSLELK